MVTNLASLPHWDSVKHLMLWHECSTTCLVVSAGSVHDDVLRIASSTFAPGHKRRDRPASPVFPSERKCDALAAANVD
jgi:hypothetical protein